MSDPVLPAEVLRLIFSLLPPRHLAPALLVCSMWRQVGEAPRLWRNVILRVTRDNIGLMPKVLGARRMLEVSEITVGVVKDVEMAEDVEKVENFDKVLRGEIRLLTARSFDRVENVKRVEENEKIKDVEEVEDFKKVAYVKMVEDSDKVEDIKKVEDVDRVKALLLAISRHRRLTRLNLSGTDLTSVEAGVLAGVLAGVDLLMVKAAKMSTIQMKTFLGTLGGQTRLKMLSFSDIDLTAVDPALMAPAVNHLEGVNFDTGSAKLTNMQVEAIFAHMADNDSKLRTLGCDFSTVPLPVIARALNKLEKYSGTLDGPIAEALLKQSLVQTKLTRAIITISKKLDVDMNLVRAARKVIPHLDVSKTAVYHQTSAECPNNHPQ